MNLNILKQGVFKIKGSVWDLFELDSFNRLLGILPDQIIEILDRYIGVYNVPEAELELYVAMALYDRMGGTDKTPTNEAIAFMFVLLNSPNFRFQEFVTLMVRTIYTDNVFKYLEEARVSAPSEYINSLYTLLEHNVAICTILSDRHKFTVDTEMPEDEQVLFNATILHNVEDYLKGGDATLNAFNNLIN
jgi:hypothetical protein